MSKKRIVIRKIASPEKLTEKYIEILDILETKTLPNDARCIKTGAYWWVAYYKGVPVGFSGLLEFPRLDAAFLYRTGVLKDYRGLGLQRKFIRLREQQAIKDGYRRIITYTIRENLRSANNLIKSGYTLYTPKKDYGPKNALYFEKVLK